VNPTNIDYVNVTWNVFPGCPPPNCYYCYAMRQLRRHVDCDDCFNFRPHVHEERLHQPFFVKKPLKIFADSTGDPLKWASGAWINLWIEVMRTCHWHTFMILTKNPIRYREFDWPENCWLGVTIESEWQMQRLLDLTQGNGKNIKFVSFEPLLGSWPYAVHAVDWVIVGAQTGPEAVKPREEWVEKIIWMCRYEKVPLFLKDNLHWPKKIQEYPEVVT